MRELVRLWCTDAGMVLDGTDDGSVIARAMARVRSVLPAEALVAGGEVISPVRTRGKTRRNLGCWELRLRAATLAEMSSFKERLAKDGWRVMPTGAQMNEVDDAHCLSIVVPEESRVGSLAACLVN